MPITKEKNLKFGSLHKKIGLRSTEVGSLNLMCESPKAFPVLVKGDANLLSAQRTQREVEL